jgi:hypothetical protein
MWLCQAAEGRSPGSALSPKQVKTDDKLGHQKGSDETFQHHRPKCPMKGYHHFGPASPGDKSL